MKKEEDGYIILTQEEIDDHVKCGAIPSNWHESFWGNYNPGIKRRWSDFGYWAIALSLSAVLWFSVWLAWKAVFG